MLVLKFYLAHQELGDITRDDLQRPFLAQHSVAMLEKCCNYSKQCRNNVATLCCAKNITFRLKRYIPLPSLRYVNSDLLSKFVVFVE